MAFPTVTVTPGTGATINTLPPAGQAVAASSLPVVLASDQPVLAVTGPATDAQMRATPIPVSGTVAVGGTLPAFATTPTVNIATAPAIVLGAGAAAIGTVGVTGSVTVTAAALPLPTGAAASAKQPALGTAGTASTDVLSVQGIAGGVAQPVSGTVGISGTVPTSLASLPALATGANAIGSITNTGFAINGTLPAFAAAPTVNIGTAPAIALAAGAAAIGTVGVTGTVVTNSTIVAAIPAGSALIGSVLVPETTFFNDTTTAIAASATYSGTARDVGVAAGTATPSTYFNAFFFADQTGTANVQCSNDGTTWRTIATAAIAVSTPLLLSVPVMTRYHRVQLVNGATLQTAVMVNSSFSGS